MASESFRADVSRHLESRGLRGEVARDVAELLDDFLEFRVEGEREVDVHAYIGFAFGNRPDPFANLEPGNVNQLLANVLAKKYAEQPKPVIAQWEIGELLRKDSAVPSKDLISVGQEFDRVMGRPNYQSTTSFLKVVADTFRDSSVKHLFVVAQWFHYARCVREVRQAGFVPVIEQDAMPREFCTDDFGQLWTSGEGRFVLHTLIGSLSRCREARNEEWKRIGRI